MKTTPGPAAHKILFSLGALVASIAMAAPASASDFRSPKMPEIRTRIKPGENLDNRASENSAEYYRGCRLHPLKKSPKRPNRPAPAVTTETRSTNR